MNTAVEEIEKYLKSSSLDLLCQYDSGNNVLNLIFDDIEAKLKINGTTFYFSTDKDFTINTVTNIKVGSNSSSPCDVTNSVAIGDLCFARYYQDTNRYKMVSINSFIRDIKSHSEDYNNPHETSYSKICPYRVGDIYMTTLLTDPNTNWDNTTWQQLPNSVFPISTNSTTKTTGGSQYITIANLPSHTHTGTFTGTALPTHNHTFTGNALAGHSHTFTGGTLPTHGHTFTGNALAGHTHTRGTWEITGKTPGDHSRMDVKIGGVFHIVAEQSVYWSNNYASYIDECHFNASRTWTGNTSSDGAGTIAGSLTSVSGGTPTGTVSNATTGATSGTISSVSGGTPTGTIAINNTGGGTPYWQPYYIVRMWLRLT